MIDARKAAQALDESSARVESLLRSKLAGDFFKDTGLTCPDQGSAADKLPLWGPVPSAATTRPASR